jgi:hypothetical protein
MDRPDLRILLFGLAAAGALVAAVVIAFSALGGSVAFDDFPKRAGQPGEGETYVRSETAHGGAGSSARGDRATGSVGTTAPATGADPVLTDIRTADSRGSGSQSAEGDAGGTDGDSGSDPSPEPPGASPPGSSPTTPSPPGSSPPDSAVPDAPPAPPTETALNGGPLTSAVATLDEAAEEVTGVDPPIDEVTAPVTEPVDEAVAGIAGG